MTGSSVLSDAVVEEWRPVVGFEGAYEVSSLGRVRSLDRMVPRRGGTLRRQAARVLKDKPGPKGYRMISLCCEGRVLYRYVHRIVLEAFVGPCPPGFEGCHRLGLRSDNRLSELRWDTRAANQADRLAHGTDQLGEKNGSAVLTTEQVLAIRNASSSERTLGALYGVAPGTVGKIKRRERWAHV